VNEYDIINFENRLMANVFAKRPLVITRGKGALVWDIKGKEYIDCMGSYGVALLGHFVTQAFTTRSEQNFYKNS